MKKLVSFVLCLTFIMSGFCLAATAVSEDPAQYPVILVPGYSGSDLDMVDESGNRQKVWGFEISEITQRVLDNILELGQDLALTVNGQGQALGKTVGEQAVDMLGELACDSNGESVNNIVVKYPTAAEMRMDKVMERNDGENTFEKELFANISGKVGVTNCFFFQTDWRMSVLQAAADLDVFIQQVKEISGKDKVNLIAVSHGGQVSATYLSLYGNKRDVCKAVLTVPAAGGAALAYDIMSENVKLDEYTLVYFIQHGMVSQDEYKWLVKAQELGFLDDVIEGFVPYAKQLVGNFRSIWDFIPAEYYDEMKGKYLDETENAGIISYSDVVHYEIMPNYHEALTRCRDEYGIDVSIIAGCGHPSVTGLQANSDAIITTNDSTGAICTDMDERFADGYMGEKTSCSNPEHDHISPSFEIDATTAYLPENTWYIDELYHGMTFLDEYTLGLSLKLLLTNDIADVHSNPDYPQFRASSNSNNTVYATFNKSPIGYVSSADRTLVVKNISTKYPVKISSITFYGADIYASTLGSGSIAPGESKSFELKGELPKESLKNIQVRVDYICEGRAFTPNGCRVLDFKLDNGEAVELNADNPTVKSGYKSSLKYVFGEESASVMENTAMFDFLQLILNFFVSLFKQLGLTGII